ncbi:hypothetical protein [Brevibacillus porteri]|uniref:hypothetical protein n=1 Tax=Brevibacillus porteri TaxID=2126350 RepID=UPI003628AB19
MTKAIKDFIEKVKQYENTYQETLYAFFDDNKWCMGTRSKRFVFNIHGKTFKSLVSKKILVNKQWGNEYQASLSLNDKYR